MYTAYISLCLLVFLKCKTNGCLRNAHNNEIHDNILSNYSDISDLYNYTLLKNGSEIEKNITNSIEEESSNSDSHTTVTRRPILFKFGNSTDKNIISTQRLIHFHKPILPFRTTNIDDEVSCKISEAQILFSGKCQRILSQGTCNVGKWIVFDKFQIPKCTLRKCPPDEIFYKNKCVNVTDANVCGENEILYVEYTGNAYCDCQQGFRFNSKTLKCYREHDTGYCSYGMYQERVSKRKVICKNNPCIHPNLILNNDDKKCYEKDFVGRCDLKNRDYVLIFQASTMKAHCESISERNIFEVPALACPTGSRRDYLNKCQRIISFNKRFSNLFVIPTQFTSRYSKCSAGYVKYPNNSCRKVNSLFNK